MDSGSVKYRRNNETGSGELIINQIDLTSYATADSASGSVTATIVFTVLSTGSTALTLEFSPDFDYYFTSPNTAQTGNVDVSGTTTVNAQYGSSTVPTSTVYGPTADFTPSDGSSFLLGSSITLNASLSQPGYDTETCPITNYAWSVEYLNGTTFASFTGENATFTAAVVGTFRIILIVTAVDVHSPSDSGYESTGSTSAEINVISNKTVVSIGVFAAQGGTGSTASIGEYGPLQIVQMYATVILDNVSMPNQNVLFSIQNSNSTVIAVKQGLTNATGIASNNFRLPTPDPSTPQISFGIWTIKASVNVAGNQVSGVTKFNFNYLSGIENVTIPASIHRSEAIPIQLTINNAYLPKQWSQLSITIFDQAGIPIGSTTIMTTQQTQNITVIDATLTIPSWAFTGQATVCLCLLTNSTNNQTIPVAPETIANFDILP